MKVTKEKAAQNRATLVQAAGRLFRERGIDGVGVAEICQAAGLTHGALYAQFPPKEALAAEALAAGLDRSYAYMTAGKDEQPPGLTEYLNRYLSGRLRDNLAGGCPMAASASEIARQDESISPRFSEGFEGTVETIQEALGPSESSSFFQAEAGIRDVAVTGVQTCALPI